MKDMFESPETFTAYAIIDAGIYTFQEMLKEMAKPINQLDKAIDIATGYAKDKHQQNVKQAIDVLKDVIKAKKVIEADYRKDEEMLAGLLKMQKWEN